MIKKMISERRRKTIGIVVGSIIVEIVILAVCLTLEWYMQLIVGGISFLIMLIFVILGIVSLSKEGTEIYDYCKKNGIIAKQLDADLEMPKEINNVYFGKEYMIFLSQYSICIHSIANMEYVKLIRIRSKNSTSFSLRFKSKEVEEETSKYFGSSESAKQVFEEIENRNPNVKVFFP